MSKVSEAHKAQEYNPKPVPQVCGTCKHMTSEMVLPSWMVSRNNDAKERGVRIPYPEHNARPGNFRCGIGKFAIKKMGTCKVYEAKA